MKKHSSKKWIGYKELEKEKLKHWKKVSTKVKMEFLEESLKFIKFCKK
jgi:hypothetical protein